MIRKAHMCDVPLIHDLVNRFAEEELMLSVSRVDLYDRLRDFFVFEDGEKVIGCAALHFTWENLAEVRSLAVRRDSQKKGVGKALVERALAEAREFECSRVFTLTFVPAFFEKLGFRRIDKAELPHKVWADCIKCPKFPDCNEISLALDLD
jgi:amino-acid N-acetyltransferase